MTGMEEIFRQFRALHRDELERWIAQEWVRPERVAGQYRFHEIDIARIGLIIELRETLEVDERALPTVLSLLDQIYELRRRMAALNAAMAESVPDDIRAAVFKRLGG